MSESEATVLKYQWIKGDNSGTIEVLDKTEDGFMIFESKRRLNAQLLSEFMVQINSDSDILNMEPVKALDIEQATGLSYENSTHKSSIQQAAQKVEPANPIRILLEKQSKYNQLKIEFELSVNVPKKEVIELLQDSFDDDIKEEVIKYSKDKLNKKEIIEQLYAQLEETINMYYS